MTGFGNPATVLASSTRVSNTLRTSHPIVSLPRASHGLHSARSELFSLHPKRRVLTSERSAGSWRLAVGVQGSPDPTAVAHDTRRPSGPEYAAVNASVWRWSQR